MERKHNKKATVIALIVCLILLSVSVAVCVYLLGKPTGTWVEIVQNEEVVYRIDLEAADDRIFTIEYEGRKNTIEIKEGKICVKEAECHDHTCVKMGVLYSKALPIVCLPNRLVIRFAESG